MFRLDLNKERKYTRVHLSVTLSLKLPHVLCDYSRQFQLDKYHVQISTRNGILHDGLLCAVYINRGDFLGILLVASRRERAANSSR